MKITLKILNGILIMLFVFAFSSCETEPWTPLFNPDNLDDFTQLGGEAIYELENGVIIGTTVANTPNSFLATNKQYGDFILKYSIMVDTLLNSGVQIRSNAYLNGRVHGYQVEIDPSLRGYSGGIYDEARRAWLHDLGDNEAGRNAFKNGEWNHYRVEAIGNSIKTWINGIMCANLVDAIDDRGFIAFQVHGINAAENPATVGVQVKWKDIGIITEDLETYRSKGEDPIPAKVFSLTNQLTETEKGDGWEMLFDGSSTEKWRGAHKETFPEKGWKAEDGILALYAESGGESAEAGDIVTREQFSDFEFCLEFKLTPGANSGIKYFVTENEESTGSAIGLEYQLLDDERHGDAKAGRDGNRTTASLYDLIPAGEKRIREPGMWNMVRIVSKDRKVEHFLNGSKQVEFVRGSPAFRDLVAISKYKKWENFGEAEAGHILLQEHGNNVSFRNIKIRRLD
ncbi:MAG: DUF1080 domain-containing protein [Bacteroidales bacterium]|nr:DUF1080 domain-containing protein [Bacteroidales bacterium]